MQAMLDRIGVAVIQDYEWWSFKTGAHWTQVVFSTGCTILANLGAAGPQRA